MVRRVLRGLGFCIWSVLCLAGCKQEPTSVRVLGNQLTAYRFSNAGGGVALIEPHTANFLYYFWGTEGCMSDSFRAAGFDGQHYWRANFGRKPMEDGFRLYVPTVSAERLMIYDASGWPGQNDDALGETGCALSQEFGWEAPLHALLHTLKCPRWDKASLVAAFEASPWGRQISHEDALHSFSSPYEPQKDSLFFKYDPIQLDELWELKKDIGPGWNFLVELDDKVPAIRAARVSLPGPWMGLWIFPTDADYLLIREDDSPRIPGNAFDYHRYVDGGTKTDCGVVWPRRVSEPR